MSAPEVRPPWLHLLAVLPPDAMPTRQPVAPPGTPGAAEGSPIAGWHNLSINLSTVPLGLRHLLVVVDETGRPIAASDHVFLHWPDPADPAGSWQMRQESIGGRLEADGRFLGTCWTVVGLEPREDETPAWQSTPRPPTDGEAASLKALVAEIMARAT